MLDTYDENEKKRETLLKIEQSIFDSVMEKVNQELGPWTGSRNQNSRADQLIAAKVYKSFKNYEKNPKRKEQFFNFGRS